jgi:hypothetical protein
MCDWRRIAARDVLGMGSGGMRNGRCEETGEGAHGVGAAAGWGMKGFCGRQVANVREARAQAQAQQMQHELAMNEADAASKLAQSGLIQPRA